jgi:hypothetical protein
VSRVSSKRKSRGSFLGAAGFLFALSVGGSWYTTRGDVDMPGPLASLTRATVPRHLGEDRALGAEAEVRPAAESTPQPESQAAPSDQHVQPSEGVAASDAQEVDQSSQAESPLPDLATAPSVQGNDAGPAKLGTGTVLIGTSQGWATVFDKGKKLGTTPLRALLRAGAHTLIIRPYGEGAGRRTSIDVRPGETVKLRVDL